MIQSFRDLRVYQKGKELAVEAYRLSRKLPDEERFVLVSQLRRAATSVILNIAEGYGRKESPKDFRNFLRQALGSANEVQVLMDLIAELQYLPRSETGRISSQYAELAKMIYRLAEKWKDQRPKPLGENGHAKPAGERREVPK